LVFWDRGLQSAFPDLPDRITRWFEAQGAAIRLAAEPVGLVGGEPVKNDFKHLEAVWSAINGAGLCRHSYVVALGGGAVLDLVGFGAATAHRGYRSCACQPRA
jgi:3-dehydroquinate synthase